VSMIEGVEYRRLAFRFLCVLFGVSSVALGLVFYSENTNAGEILGQRVIYFDFDSSNLTPAAQRVAEAHAQYLARNPGMAVVLEGHADERGTRGYNLAIGHQRANAVSVIFQAVGVAPDAIRTISYGEERPVSMGQDESSWSLNRRVEILY
jgi:peptidoglycan-associated lipoprotein